MNTTIKNEKHEKDCSPRRALLSDSPARYRKSNKWRMSHCCNLAGRKIFHVISVTFLMDHFPLNANLTEHYRFGFSSRKRRERVFALDPGKGTHRCDLTRQHRCGHGQHPPVELHEKQTSPVFNPQKATHIIKIYKPARRARLT